MKGNTMQLSIESAGRRHYVRGDTYPLRERLRAAGAHWDAEARAWWFGQREAAERLPESRIEIARSIVAAAPRFQLNPGAPARHNQNNEREPPC
jgi:hypothetical protein